MMKNYNYVFLFYDINELRVSKIFKICKKYLLHHQRSVFKGPITPSKLIKLEKEINAIIRDNDFVSIIKLINESSFEETTLGKKLFDSDDLFI